MSEVPLETLLEAMLFSAGRSLSVSEISKIWDMRKKKF